ncbi:ABC transporter substrate-binding protein [Poseidonibacter ostreae]|jgi:NitT/TauT family transport system substrate-binding protein|uniref:Transporter substrate-binding domain-containing protein n=1 Tax=Poseidonibacter ostreae TaxID=2654171 RepID=A0A6L4WVW1_9BACT|nr:ABC transporter substrate-binding protein [Poseidonibacter ostreae]KAB7888044.1 transporter substrate-binding domain-containing protein [Poseidonibacter ostreae]KAB7891037.1 transporter substrate-binding domain-containing protein [Poseidonibacter ostreae]KAB7892761.1 transporter substrate-binding domain-containing protein [Poseidonibacter ostreae]MAC84638.1 ABC transporter substrate-binding protein [Arcobacter sp.]|tara:strand:- start:3494 stop:4462 length:969 start_codon:yes stop_codon:yes gene_type:complete
MKLKILILMFIAIIDLAANEKIKIGVLAFGTVNWELDVLKHNKLDEKYGIEVEVVKLASKNAVSIALQSNSVDIIVNDWVWVNRQRASGKDISFYPYSKAVGALYVNDEKIKSLLDLSQKRLGIAGGSVDKTWLLFRAYYKNKYNKDLKNMVNPVFAAPPILYKKMLDKSLNASINFWHFNAKLESKGLKRLLGVKEILEEFNISSEIPLIGWTFNSDFANKNKKAINGFLQASYETKKLLSTSEKEWDRIKPLMKVKNDEMFTSLKDGYINGIVKNFSITHIENSKKVFDILYKEGGKKLVGNSTFLDNKTFWNFTPDIKW